MTFIIGLKFALRVLLDMGLHILYNSREEYSHQTLDPEDGIPIVQKIIYTWVQHFMVKNNIVYRMQTRRRSWSPEKEKHVQMMVSFHLGVFHQGFLLENMMKFMLKRWMKCIL